MSRPVVTFTTDFGARDSFVGAMKGVVLSRCPEAQLVDITHEVPPQQVHIGALRLAAAAPFFPAGTVHVAVVDPGVGTQRRAIAIRSHGQYFVGPDNGVMALSADTAAPDWYAVELTSAAMWLPVVSTTFHGRDIFAPTAGEVARGTPLDALGTALNAIVPLELPRAIREGDVVEGEILDVDRFGNLITNVRREDLDDLEIVEVTVGSARIEGISQTYDPSRSLVALINSDAWLELAAPLANAAERLGLAHGARVRISVRPRRGVDG